MRSSSDRYIELKLKSSHPQLLEGLDQLIKLGLISDDQVKILCRQHLVCYLKLEPQAEQQTRNEPQALPRKRLIATLPPPTLAPSKPNFLISILQSLGEELSVRWLLFLGLFLVVISSGLLAASQWQNFPVIGQYGVLLLYTLGFWRLSSWIGQQNNLRLTTQTLSCVTLLLVPVNFWAMDSFGLWQNSLNWIFVAIASLILSFTTIILCKNSASLLNFPAGKLPLVNILSLSYLHWGWKLPGFPLFAAYSAMIVTTIITIRINIQQKSKLSETEDGTNFSGVYLGLIIYALLLILTRAIFSAGVHGTQLSLAIGVCGWLVTWVSQTPPAKINSSPTSGSIWGIVGGILLFLGWFLGIINQPLQAIIVTGLILQFFSYRLFTYNLKSDLTAIFFIGLQTAWLGWRLIPTPVQQFAIHTVTAITNSQHTPGAIFGIVLFPYVFLTLGFTHYLHSISKSKLAVYGDQLALILGILLTGITSFNPTVRSLNLILSTTTLVYITQKRYSSQTFLVYLTHITGLLTLVSLINWFLPHLNYPIWAGILLGLMVIEWVFITRREIWQSSAWYVGWALSIISYLLLLNNNITSNHHIPGISAGIIWLTTPITITALANRTGEQNRTRNIDLSIACIIIAQFLTFGLPINRLIGLAVGTILMMVNTRYLKNELSALITIGYGLTFLGAVLWNYQSTLLLYWMIVGAMTILSLWIGRTLLLRQNNQLAGIYAVASDQWAIALCACELLSITFHSVQIYQGTGSAEFFYFIATTITLVAIIYRTWQQPQNWAFYIIGLCLELLIAEAVGFGGHSLIKLAIANIALGLTSQLFVEWWTQKYNLQNLPNSFYVFPILYSVLSIIFRSTTFTHWTGLCSLGVALVFVRVGSRNTALKGLLYLGIIGISISLYELLLYQIFQSHGGTFADGLIAMSALGTMILYAYRIFNPWLVNYFYLSHSELAYIAHFHWFWSSFLFTTAIVTPIKFNLYLAIGTGLLLVCYAIWQAREYREPTSAVKFKITSDEVWIYLGLLEAVILGIYSQNIPLVSSITQYLLPWRGAIASVVAYVLYLVPWTSLGWSTTPWRRVAYILPLFFIWQTWSQIYSINLIIIAIYYSLLAKLTAKLRLTYISVILCDWVLFHWFYDFHLTHKLWYTTLIGLSLLFVAQIDEQFQQNNSRGTRHFLRIIGTGLICGSAIFYDHSLPLIPGIFSLIAIFAGLGLRVRAYLYVGTTTFFLTSINQLVIFSQEYSLLKWAIGLLVGILLIYIAANFETRRTQIITLARSIGEQLRTWE